ncbi:unnamed protein product [Prunus armeniaca]|uniref:Uncharacterized protein n=1 Tax=Prunus armeniaca TaxID=36596 RepID=A0A6J5U9Q5_PRUAR|nr:unnamed protein product [Prunus armeniaca]
MGEQATRTKCALIIQGTGVFNTLNASPHHILILAPKEIDESYTRKAKEHRVVIENQQRKAVVEHMKETVEETKTSYPRHSSEKMHLWRVGGAADSQVARGGKRRRNETQTTRKKRE